MFKIAINIEYFGLGNQMFKIAFLYSYAKKYKKTFGYIEHKKSFHSKINYLQTVYPFLEKIVFDSGNVNIYNEEEGKCISYVEIPNFEKDTIFNGYFQCDKYFRQYKKDIQTLFSFPLISLTPSENSVFLHVRRGDYMYSPNHYIDLTKYYLKCIQYIKQEKGDFELYVVSDDIEYCKRELGKLFEKMVTNVIFAENLNELDTMRLMMECRMGGICANSSFSWWGAYLNKNDEKMVFFPSQWFRNPKYKEWPNEVAFEGSYVVDLESYELTKIK